MKREPFQTLTSKTVVLPQANIDTDQIIPARFLKSISREGFGKALFADWRLDEQGGPRPGFPLNDPAAQGARVLVAGENFGCGSSREHAPWALTDYGFRAVVSLSIADIFRSNAVKNGLLPVVVDQATHAFLLEHSGAEVTIDLRAQTLSYDGGRKSARFPIDPFSRHCLLEGVDELGFLLSQEEAIAAFERAHAAEQA
jgi:3-isopropylmalate/(R)-2-methylmalate dehydratase small subunit